MSSRLRWIVLGSSVLLVAAGCGDGAPSSSGERVTIEATPAAMQRAADATVATSSKVEITMTMTVRGQELRMVGTGAADPVNKRMSLSFDMRELLLEAMEASGEPIPPESEALLSEPMTMLVDGNVMYMRFPAFAELLGPGKEWIKIDLSKASGVEDVFGSGSGASDPAAMLQFLRGAGDVTEVGREEIRGAQTTHYRGSYTLRQALDAAPEAQRTDVQKAMDNLGLTDEAFDQPIPYDVWIGDDGFVRRFDMKMDMTKLAPSAAVEGLGDVTVTTEFHDFGTAVDIVVPSDDEVSDLTDLVPTQSKFSSVGSSIN